MRAKENEMITNQSWVLHHETTEFLINGNWVKPTSYYDVGREIWLNNIPPNATKVRTSPKVEFGGQTFTRVDTGKWGRD